MQYKIDIPAPCHESWANMSPTEKGRFCNSCEKEVQDFTRMTEAQIILALKREKHVCGRLTSKQLEKPWIVPEKKWQVNWGLAIGLSAMLLVSYPILAHENLQETRIELVKENEKTVDTSDQLNDSLIFEGVVYSEEKEPLPFVNVMVKSDGIIVRGTTTDMDGKFSVKIACDSKDGKLDIEFSYIGFGNMTLQNIEKSNSDLVVIMEENSTIIGSIIILSEDPIIYKTHKEDVYIREGNDFIKQ